MATWMIEYVYDDRDDDRDELRPEHRAYLESQARDGRLLAYGRFDDDGPAGALLLGEVDTEDDVHRLIDQDPFVIAGLVAERRVRHWPSTWAPQLGR